MTDATMPPTATQKRTTTAAVTEIMVAVEFLTCAARALVAGSPSEDRNNVQHPLFWAEGALHRARGLLIDPETA